MDHATAFRLFTEGQYVSLVIEGRRVDRVLVKGLHAASPGPSHLDLLLPTPVDEPDRHLRVRMDKVELAP